MLYEAEDKKYYRFPNRNNLIDYEDYGSYYFPSKEKALNIEIDNINDLDRSTMKGELT